MYPHFDLYPAIASRTEPQAKKQTTSISESVVISISCPAVYPIFNLCESRQLTSVETLIKIQLDPAVYPHNLNEIYHVVTIAERSVVNHVKADTTGVHHLVETLRYNFVADPPIDSHTAPHPPTTRVDSHERLGVESQAEATVALSLKGRYPNFEICKVSS